MFAQIEIMTMLGYSMVHNVYVQIVDHKETAREINVTMVVQATVASRCAEGLDTSTSFILMPTKLLLMTGVVETLLKTNITRNGMRTWTNVKPNLVFQLSGQLKMSCDATVYLCG